MAHMFFKFFTLAGWGAFVLLAASFVHAEPVPFKLGENGLSGLHFSNLPEFKTAVDVPVDKWAKENKRASHVAGSIFSLKYEHERQLVAQAPDVSFDVNGLSELFAWFMENKWNKVAPTFKTLVSPDVWPEMTCDNAVSMWRSILRAKGFSSRSVIFDFKDGWGGKSHTFSEVWAPDLRQWLYFDPHYGVYAPNGNALSLIWRRQLVALPLPPGEQVVTSIAERQAAVEDLFTNGWHMILLQTRHENENYLFRNQLTYVN